MAVSNNIWKVWLRLNLLTEKSNDYVAEVSTVGDTARNEDVVQAIIAEGSEIKADTLLSILNQGDRIKRSFIVQGRSVQDGVCHIEPQVPGPWDGANAKYDDKVNSVGISVTAAPEMKEALKSVKVESLGVKDSGAYIGRVVNTETGEADGTISPDDDIVIEGDKIRVIPDSEAGIGVFFKNIDTAEVYPVLKRLVQNDPKKLIARVPALPEGKYTLTIVTRFSKGEQLLQTPRTVEYQLPLEVKS
jgi:hypothetical protein